MTSIAQRIAALDLRIIRACDAVGRERDSVTLVAVSKTRSADDIRRAFDAGIRDFGENYQQEVLEKTKELQDLPINWHFIGPLQTNKTRAVAGGFDWVQSLDRHKTAQRLNDQRPDNHDPLQVCIQVNISGELQKSGVDPDELLPLADAIARLPRLRLRGLMCLAQNSDDPKRTEQQFQHARALFRRLAKRPSITSPSPHASIDTLSMGMSADLESAITCGATMIRIGSAMFGARD